MTPDLAPDPANAPPAPRRRWWWAAFSLRVLMLAVLVVGGLVGWQARRANLQRRAVAQLREAGASILYDWQIRTPAQPARSNPPGPGWLRRVVGDELFQEVHFADLDVARLKPGEPTDPTMMALAGLDHLDTLNLIYPPVNDVQFARLRGLPRIKTAILLDTKLTAGAIETCRTWPSLEVLAVRFDQAQPAGSILPRLSGMDQLKRLNLSPIGELTPADLATLGTLPNLEYLALRPSPVDEACLVPLAGLARLKGIHLSETRVTDAGMRRLAPLAALERVALDGESLTDEGLAVVAGWPKLQELFLVGRGVDDEGRPPTGRATDRGLAALAGHPSLDNLALAGHFGDAGLAALGRVPKLDTLILYGLEPRATAEGLRALLTGRTFRQLGLHGPGVHADWGPLLAGQGRLEYLSLAGPNVDDALLRSLAGMPSLGRLFVSDAAITDAGLMALARVNNGLRILYLRRTAATPAGVAAFQAARPGCQVDYQPAPAVLNPIAGLSR